MLKALALALTLTLTTCPAAAAFEGMLDFYHQQPKPRKIYRKRSKPQPPPSKPEKLAHHTNDARCLPAVRVVGSQDIRETAAEDSAKKAWSEAVRWAHGEAYMDMLHAKAYQRRCSRSSIGEVAGQVFIRCEVSAAPCRPGMSDTKD